MKRTTLALLGACAVLACESTYHPEYHPVTISNVHQDLSYPVVVNNTGNPAERSPVVIAPFPMPAPPPAGPVAPAAEDGR